MAGSGPHLALVQMPLLPQILLGAHFLLELLLKALPLLHNGLGEGGGGQVPHLCFFTCQPCLSAATREMAARRKVPETAGSSGGFGHQEVMENPRGPCPITVWAVLCGRAQLSFA